MESDEGKQSLFRGYAFKGILSAEPVECVKATIVTGPALQILKEVFKLHGITLKNYTGHMELNLPSGSTQMENLPRIHTCVFTITLPDSFRLFAVGTTGGLYNVSVEIESLPPDLQEKAKAMYSPEMQQLWQA